MLEKKLKRQSMKQIGERDLKLTANSNRQLAALVDTIVENCQEERINNVGTISAPSRRKVVELVEDLRDLIYPGCFGQHGIPLSDVANYVSDRVTEIFNKLSFQISLCTRHECVESGERCTECVEFGQTQAATFLNKIPELRKMLAGDVKAAFDRDPAARNLEEVVLSYPGVLAITIYRLAHELWLQGVLLIARMMTEHAHSITGIDIHPGANIGANFFIDHGTGVVIGETTEIGNNVTIYQGVTLGGYRFRRRADGSLERGYKRHPTVGDNVIIYAGATILGGDTVIGAGSVIGGSVWLTHSVPANAVVTIQEPDLKYRVGYQGS